MPRAWVVSCHGSTSMEDVQVGSSARTIRAVRLIPVPPGIRFVHFVSEGTVLDAAGWPAYNALMGSPPDFDAVERIPGYTVFDGASLPDYELTGDDNWVDANNLSASGIFVVGDTLHRDPMTLYLGPGDTYSLGQFFNDPEVRAGDTVYWIACRAWLKDGRLVGFPKPPPPLPSRPPPARATGQISSMLGGLPPGTMSPAPGYTS